MRRTSRREALKFRLELMVGRRRWQHIKTYNADDTALAFVQEVMFRLVLQNPGRHFRILLWPENWLVESTLQSFIHGAIMPANSPREILHEQSPEHSQARPLADHAKAPERVSAGTE